MRVQRYESLPAFGYERALPVNLRPEQADEYLSDRTQVVGPSYGYEVAHASVDHEGIVFAGGQILGYSLERGRIGRLRLGKLLRKTMARHFPKTGDVILPEAFWLTDKWSFGYFHWMADVLPLLMHLRDRLQSAPLLLPPECSDPFVRESLEMLGIEARWLVKGQRAFVKNLVLHDLLAPTGHLHPPTLARVRDHLLREAPESKQLSPRRIFLTRKKAQRRRLVNEEELSSLLEQAGFTIVTMENHSLREQIAMVRHAEVLAGPHGAGLANMLFLPPGGKVLEVRSREVGANGCFRNLASVLGHDYYYALADPVGGSGNHADLRLSPEELEMVLEDVCTVTMDRESGDAPPLPREL